MASSYSTRSSRTPKSAVDDGFQKGFYGTNLTVQNKGISLLKKKKKPKPVESDIRTAVKNLDHYKSCADKLYSSLMSVLFESKSSAETMATTPTPSRIPLNPGYQHCSDFLATYEALQKYGMNEVKTESLDEAVRATKKLAEEQEKYVRIQLETLKPLTKFVGEEYWEFAKARHVYVTALEKFESINTGNKSIRPGSMEPSQTGASLEKAKNDARTRMLSILTKIVDKREEQSICVIRFAKQASEWHKNSGSILSSFDAKTQDEYNPKANETETKSPAHSSRTKKVHRKASKEHSSR